MILTELPSQRSRKYVDEKATDLRGVGIKKEIRNLYGCCNVTFYGVINGIGSNRKEARQDFNVFIS